MGVATVSQKIDDPPPRSGANACRSDVVSQLVLFASVEPCGMRRLLGDDYTVIVLLLRGDRPWR